MEEENKIRPQIAEGPEPEEEAPESPEAVEELTRSEQIEELLEQKQYARLRDLLVEMEAPDIYALLEDLTERQQSIVFRLLPKALAAETFVEMDGEVQEMLIRGFSDTELREVLEELYLDDTVDIIEEMPATVVKRILRQSDPESRRAINELLKYPRYSAGSIMTPEYVDLHENTTVADAFKRIRRIGLDRETIYICYVTDENRRLLGLVSVRTLLLAAEDDIIEDIMESDVISVDTLTDQEEVARMLSKYDFVAIPVVDKENRLVGIVTVDDAIDVMEEEATEDIEKMAAITPTDKPYLRTGPLETWKARIPWLMILMLSATFTSMIISHFETALAACIVLNSYIPMLTGTGGNSGTQASVAVIRALSLDEVEFSDILRVVWKESRVGILCGVVLAAANFVKMLLFDRLLMGDDSVTIGVAAVVCLTLVLVVFVAKFVGSVLPLLAKKLRLDPAVMASPFISTIVDALSLLIYFQFAHWLLGV
ncbi:MAG: magnesium transporter [Oscillospiraceae bacterium]